MGGQGLDRGDEAIADGLGVVSAVRQVDEHGVAGAALDQGGDCGASACTDDQVAFPVAGHGPVVDGGGAVADHHHRVDLPLDRACRPSQGTSDRPQRTAQRMGITDLFELRQCQKPRTPALFQGFQAHRCCGHAAHRDAPGGVVDPAAVGVSARGAAS